MADESLARALQAADRPVDYLRGWGRFTSLPDEYTHWMEEQRAWRETCALMDLSYHMVDFEVTGPDAIDLLAAFSANRYEGFDVGQAKQLVVANPDGFFHRRRLFRLADDHLLAVGPAAGLDWLEYQAEVGDFDVDAELRGRPVSTGAEPRYFRYQVQGPDALAVVQEAVDGPLPETGFFSFDELSIDGESVDGLRHGMAGEPGYELFGPYERGAAVKEALLAAGEAYDIRRVGGRAYVSVVVESGWVSLPVPATYDSDAMADYRAWLSAKRGTISIGGSYVSEDVADYYVTPLELDDGRFIDFDRDFVGRDALVEEREHPERKQVTLEWHAEDALDLFGSRFRDGPTATYLELPTPRWAACQYDEVLVDGEHGGVTAWTSYSANERELLSLAIVDVEHADPGSEVTLVWGEPADSPNPQGRAARADGGPGDRRTGTVRPGPAVTGGRPGPATTMSPVVPETSPAGRFPSISTRWAVSGPLSSRVADGGSRCPTRVSRRPSSQPAVPSNCSATSAWGRSRSYPRSSPTGSRNSERGPRAAH